MFKENYCRDIDALTLGAQGKEKILQAMEGRKSQDHRLGRTFLIAAALCAALAVTALAVELTVGWESFLGRTPHEAATPVGVSAVTGDYTLALQEAIVDDTGAAFLLALTRNDGGAIENDPRFLHDWDVKVDGEHFNMGYSTLPPIRSTDGKTVYYCVEFDGQEIMSLSEKTITFQCDGISDGDWSDEEIELVRRETVSLSPLVQTVRRLDLSEEELWSADTREELLPLVTELSAQVTIPLVKMGEGKAWVSAVLISSDGLPMVVVGNSRGSVRQGQYLMGNCTALVLTDTRTGERWGCTGNIWQGDDEGFYLCYFKDCPLIEEELPYFEVTVDYGTQKLLSDEPVELSFSANVGHQLTVKLDEDITFNYIGDCTVHVTQANVSALRLWLSFDQIKRSGWDWENHPAKNTQWAVMEKDGTQILLTPPAIRTDQDTGTGWIALEGRSENLDRRLIDPDQAEALLIGDIRVPLQQ